MTINNRQKALLHVAKGKLRMSDNEYRSCFMYLAGVESSADLDQDGFEAIMVFFDWRDFRSLVAEGPPYGNRPGMATFAQLELIRCLWRKYARGAAGEDELNTWLLDKFRLSSLSFVDMKTARKMIAALKAMKAIEMIAARGVTGISGAASRGAAPLLYPVARRRPGPPPPRHRIPFKNAHLRISGGWVAETVWQASVARLSNACYSTSICACTGPGDRAPQNTIASIRHSTMADCRRPPASALKP